MIDIVIIRWLIAILVAVAIVALALLVVLVMMLVDIERALDRVAAEWRDHNRWISKLYAHGTPSSEETAKYIATGHGGEFLMKGPRSTGIAPRLTCSGCTAHWIAPDCPVHGG